MFSKKKNPIVYIGFSPYLTTVIRSTRRYTISRKIVPFGGNNINLLMHCYLYINLENSISQLILGPRAGSEFHSTSQQRKGIALEKKLVRIVWIVHLLFNSREYWSCLILVFSNSTKTWFIVQSLVHGVYICNIIYHIMLKNISTKFVNNLQRLIKKKKKFSQSNKLSFKQSILNEGKVITKFSRLFTTVSNYLLFQTIYNKRVEERSCCHVLERCHVERKGGASFTPEARSANISWRISGSHFCDFNYSLDPSSSRH